MRVLLKIYFRFSLAPKAVIFPVLLKAGREKVPLVITLSYHFSRSGLFTPEPDYSLVDTPEFPAGENSRECSSSNDGWMSVTRGKPFAHRNIDISFHKNETWRDFFDHVLTCLIDVSPL